MDSRPGSSGSNQNFDNTPPSSNQNSEDEDDSGDNAASFNFSEKEQEAYIKAKKKRRDAMKKRFNSLQELVPTCKQTDQTGYKLSKADILLKSVEYIQYLVQKRKRHDDKREALRKDVEALRLMQANYEQMLMAQNSDPENNEAPPGD